MPRCQGQLIIPVAVRTALPAASPRPRRPRAETWTARPRRATPPIEMSPLPCRGSSARGPATPQWQQQQHMQARTGRGLE